MAHEETRSESKKASAHPGGKGNGSSRRASADEVLEAMANEAAEPSRPSSSFGRAIRDVFLVAALLGGGTYLYYNHVTVKEKVLKLAVEAADKMEKDDLRALRQA